MSDNKVAKRNPLVRLWLGQEPLWKAYWIFGCVWSLGVAFIAFILVSMTANVPYASLGVLALIWVWYLFVFVAIWRCAFNVEWRGWGYLARAASVAGFTVVLFNMGSVLNRFIVHLGVH